MDRTDNDIKTDENDAMSTQQGNVYKTDHDQTALCKDEEKVYMITGLAVSNESVKDATASSEPLVSQQLAISHSSLPALDDTGSGEKGDNASQNDEVQLVEEQTGFRQSNEQQFNTDSALRSSNQHTNDNLSFSPDQEGDSSDGDATSEPSQLTMNEPVPKSSKTNDNKQLTQSKFVSDIYMYRDNDSNKSWDTFPKESSPVPILYDHTPQHTRLDNMEKISNEDTEHWPQIKDSKDTICKDTKQSQSCKDTKQSQSNAQDNKDETQPVMDTADSNITKAERSAVNNHSNVDSGISVDKKENIQEPTDSTSDDDANSTTIRDHCDNLSYAQGVIVYENRIDTNGENAALDGGIQLVPVEPVVHLRQSDTFDVTSDNSVSKSVEFSDDTSTEKHSTEKDDQGTLILTSVDNQGEPVNASYSDSQNADDPATVGKAEQTSHVEDCGTQNPTQRGSKTVNVDVSPELTTNDTELSSQRTKAESDSGCSGLDENSDHSSTPLPVSNDSNDATVSTKPDAHEKPVNEKEQKDSKQTKQNREVLEKQCTLNPISPNAECIEHKTDSTVKKKSDDMTPSNSSEKASNKNPINKISDTKRKNDSTSYSKRKKPYTSKACTKPIKESLTGIDDDGYANTSSPNSKEQSRQKDEMNNEDSRVKKKNSKTRNRKTVQTSIKQELKTQMSNYLYDERRMLGFNPNSAPSAPAFSTVLYSPVQLHKRIRPDPRSCYKPMVSGRESKRLSKLANQTFDSLDIGEIWNFHEFKIGKGTMEKSPRNGFVQNYSRHLGNILHTSEYSRFYDKLYSKK